MREPDASDEARKALLSSVSGKAKEVAEAVTDARAERMSQAAQTEKQRISPKATQVAVVEHAVADAQADAAVRRTESEEQQAQSAAARDEDDAQQEHAEQLADVQRLERAAARARVEADRLAADMP